MTEEEINELQVLKRALSDPVIVYINMLRGVIAVPSFDSLLHFYGEVFNDTATANIEVARLRERVKELEDELKLYTD